MKFRPMERNYKGDSDILRPTLRKSAKDGAPKLLIG
jgi:hypothetical protein